MQSLFIHEVALVNGSFKVKWEDDQEEVFQTELAEIDIFNFYASTDGMFTYEQVIIISEALDELIKNYLIKRFSQNEHSKKDKKQVKSAMHD